MQVQKMEKYSHSRNLGGEAEHQFGEIKDGFVNESSHEPRKDNRMELVLWCNTINSIPLENSRGLVKVQRSYLTQLNENPKHSDRSVEEWTAALQGHFETEELTRAYAISMLNQQSANSFSDWEEFGDAAELGVLIEIGPKTEAEEFNLPYPDSLNDVIKDRVEKMIRFLDRKPNIRALGKRFELVHMLR